MVRRLWRVAAILTFVIGCTPILLSACAAPSQPYNPPPANLPLANLQTCTLANLHQAAYNYAHYHALALRRARDRPPHDLLGLKRLTEVCTALEQAGVEDESCREAAALREELEAKTDDRRIVAKMLDVPVEDVELGPNLVENGGFEEWVEGKSKGWAWSNMATGDPWNKGIFSGGADRLTAWNGASARISGLWLQQRDDRAPGRCGYWQWGENGSQPRLITLTVQMPYALILFYRTGEFDADAAAVYLLENSDVFFFGDRYLPSTGGKWQRFAVIGWNRTGQEVAVRPLMRNFAAEQVWFDNVQLRAINLQSSVPTGDTQFLILSRD